MRSFVELFDRPSAVRASAPGRVNLIGEHTDYNDGFVLPAAIPLHTVVELAPRADRRVGVWSAAFPDAAPIEFPLDALAPAHDWADYVRGMFWALGHPTNGCDVRIASDVPLGSGLSSSASLLVAVARALRSACALPLDDLQIAVAARRAETDFVGAPVGIMDQMACSLADPASALFIDTRSLAYERVPIPAAAALAVIDSGIRHSHTGGEYRTRRAECERAAAALGVPALRDVSMNELARVDALPEPINRRARHVVTENQRVLDTVAALRAGDLRSAGALFAASHASLRDDFQVSVPQIDGLVTEAERVQGVYGARLTGGGFGGSIVVLADAAQVTAAAREVITAHNARFSPPARVVVPAA